MFTTAFGLDDVQHTLIALTHKETHAPWQLTYMSAIVKPQPERSLIVLAVPTDVAAVDVGICEFDIGRRASGWHREVTGLRSPLRLQQTARVFDYDEIMNTSLRDECNNQKLQEWLKSCEHKVFVFVWIEPSARPGLCAVGWLCPKSTPPLAGFRFKSVQRQWMITSPTRNPLKTLYLLNYLLTRLHICWSTTKINVLGDLFRCWSETIGFFNV